MRIHAVDVSGGNVELQDDSMVEKYTISEDVYNEREGKPGFPLKLQFCAAECSCERRSCGKYIL